MTSTSDPSDADVLAHLVHRTRTDPRVDELVDQRVDQPVNGEQRRGLCRFLLSVAAVTLALALFVILAVADVGR